MKSSAGLGVTFNSESATLRRLVGVFAAVLVLLTVTIPVAATGTAAAQSVEAPDCSTVSYDGAGTEANPYEVSNVDQLQCIESQGLDASYKLVSDINASETPSWDGGRGFEPIGEFNSSDESFNGTFDGNGHEIKDLTIERPDEFSVGLFGFVGADGEIANVSVVDVDITGNSFVGGLVGWNGGTVRSSSASGNVAGNDVVGGLVGRNAGGSGAVQDSSASGNVTGNDGVGGLVGSNADSTVRNSSASGNVAGNNAVGGLVGGNNGIVCGSSASGSVSGDENVGGLVGWNAERGTVRYSSASGDVIGNNEVGGLAGYNEGTVRDSSAFGDVTGSGNIAHKLVKRNSQQPSEGLKLTFVGRLIGENRGTVRNSSASGDVTIVYDGEGRMPSTAIGLLAVGFVAISGLSILLVALAVLAVVVLLRRRRRSDDEE